jgi:transglutaminase-like putative cysteine protease
MPWVGLGATALISALAGIRRLPMAIGLGVALLVGPVAAWFAAAAEMAANHPLDPTGPALVQVWMARIASGESASDNAVFLFLLALLFWLVCLQLAWAVVRWRQPLMGVIPIGAVIATNLINYPQGQTPYAIAFPILAAGLLMTTAYRRRSAAARFHGLRIQGGLRTRHLRTGLIAVALIVLAAILVPPLSTVDTSGHVQDMLSARLGLPGGSRSAVAPAEYSFPARATLGGPIDLGPGTVFSYSPDSAYGGPGYFRVVNLTDLESGGLSWFFRPQFCGNSCPGSPPTLLPTKPVPCGVGGLGCSGLQPANGLATDLPGRNRASSTILVTLNTSLTISTPAVRRVLPYPDELVRYPLQAYPEDDMSDSLVASVPTTGYSLTVGYSTGTEDQLRAASAVTAVPKTGLATYEQPPPLDPKLAMEITNLDQAIVKGTSNYYDEATAIDRYLLSFRYTLSPPTPKPGVSPLEYFLFNSRAGYCQYFAAAMGDMLRQLGIPTRLVNGFGPGRFDSRSQRYVVRASDAHTWVEVYFQNYGWIPFEPTPDPTYAPIARGPQAQNSQTSANPVSSPSPEAKPSPIAPAPGQLPTPIAPSRFPGTPQVPAAIPFTALAILVVTGLWFGGRRYLRPTQPRAIWRRALQVSRLVGVRADSHETPMEFAGRLADRLPDHRQGVLKLAEEYQTMVYRNPGAPLPAPGQLAITWATLLPVLLKQAARRLWPHSPH